MITLLYGPNNYKVRQTIHGIVQKYATAAVDYREGADLTKDNLPELLQGVSLFASERAVVVKDASLNKQLWDDLPLWLDKVPEEIHLVIVEEAPDKRTKTFKALQKQAEVVVCDELNEAQAIDWLLAEAKKQAGVIERIAAKELVERVGIDQWRLSHELEKLLLVGDTSVAKIQETIEATPHANVFALLDAAFSRRSGQVKELLVACIAQEDPYKFFGLLASQVFQLAVVASAEDNTIEQIAKDIGAHPYPIKKMQPVAKKLSKQDLALVVEAVAKLDDQMKSSTGEPWLLIESALLKVASR